MDVDTIIATARSDAVPYTWNVWTLRRGHLLRTAAYWGGVSIVGLFLFVLDLVVAVPDNLKRGPNIIALSLGVLLIFGVMGFGGLYLLMSEMGRLRLSSKYLLIMTPDDYVKVEPRRVTHVPMDQIEDITLKGVRIPHEEATRESSRSQLSAFGAMGFGRLFGNLFSRRPQQPPSLAFRDRRNGRVVVVATDASFDDLIALEQVLQIHVGAKQRTQRV